jgi:hypothetical protein
MKVEHFSHNLFNDEHWNTLHYWFDDVKIEPSNHLQKLLHYGLNRIQLNVEQIENAHLFCSLHMSIGEPFLKFVHFGKDNLTIIKKGYDHLFRFSFLLFYFQCRLTTFRFWI